MSGSEIAQFRQQQAMQAEAARQGLSGMAAIARHDFIEMRITREAQTLSRLMEEGTVEEIDQVITMMQEEIRVLEGLEGGKLRCHTMNPP